MLKEIFYEAYNPEFGLKRYGDIRYNVHDKPQDIHFKYMNALSPKWQELIDNYNLPAGDALKKLIAVLRQTADNNDVRINTLRNRPSLARPFLFGCEIKGNLHLFAYNANFLLMYYPYNYKNNFPFELKNDGGQSVARIMNKVKEIANRNSFSDLGIGKKVAVGFGLAAAVAMLS
nr:MAG TPA: hypothetical protein [Caudoviricetes sp.]